MATDTIVGIVGAVVLVGIMAGVFVYEYNNEPPPVDRVDDGEPDTFSLRYPTLAAGEDLDGDGVPNVEDDDIDGDGVANEEDLDVKVVVDMQGITLGRHAPPVENAAPVEVQQFIGSNTTRVHIKAIYPATVPERNTVSMTLLDADGNVVAQGQNVPPNNPRVTNPVTLAIELTGAQPAGNYTLRLEQVDFSDEISFNTVTWTLTYLEEEFEEEAEIATA